jgi:hypothetical protein
MSSRCVSGLYPDRAIAVLCRTTMGDDSTFDASLPRVWRVVKPRSLSFSTHRPVGRGAARLAPGDLLRYEETSTYRQGCDNETNVIERFVVLSGAFGGHCVTTWGV